MQRESANTNHKYDDVCRQLLERRQLKRMADNEVAVDQNNEDADDEDDNEDENLTRKGFLQKNSFVRKKLIKRYVLVFMHAFLHMCVYFCNSAYRYI